MPNNTSRTIAIIAFLAVAAFGCGASDPSGQAELGDPVGTPGGTIQSTPSPTTASTPAATPDEVATPTPAPTATPDGSPIPDHDHDYPSAAPTSDLPTVELVVGVPDEGLSVADAREGLEVFIRAHAADHHLPFGNLPGCMAASVMGVFSDERVLEIYEAIRDTPPTGLGFGSPGIPSHVSPTEEQDLVVEAAQSCAPFDALFRMAVDLGGNTRFTESGASCIEEAWGNEEAYRALALNAVYDDTESRNTLWGTAIRACKQEAFDPLLHAALTNMGVTGYGADCVVTHTDTETLLGLVAPTSLQQENGARGLWAEIVAHCEDHE